MTLNQIKALIKESEETGRPIQYFGSGAWETMAEGENASLIDHCRHYRVAPPEPPKPREWWVMPGGVNPVVPLEMCNRTSAQMIAAGYVLTREAL